MELEFEIVNARFDDRHRALFVVSRSVMGIVAAAHEADVMMLVFEVDGHIELRDGRHAQVSSLNRSGCSTMPYPPPGRWTSRP